MARATRAKFICNGITQRVLHPGSEKPFVYDAEFYAVSPSKPLGDEENRSFWDATPSGSIKLSTIRADHFVPGKNYYVDFSEVE